MNFTIGNKVILDPRFDNSDAIRFHMLSIGKVYTIEKTFYQHGILKHVSVLDDTCKIQLYMPERFILSTPDLTIEDVL